jgi:hypothetical protein
MVVWKPSSRVKKKILDVSKDLDNDKRVLFLLKNLGPQRFTDLEKNCDLSRSTVSKYLRLHLEQNNVEKRVYTTDTDSQEMRYFITRRGQEQLISEDISSEGDVFLINQIKDNLEKLSNLKDFYEDIGVDDTIKIQIFDIILKIGDKFFDIPQNRDLFLTLFYIINYNSILTPDYKLNLKQFCEVYNINELEINYFIRKIMSKDLGFFMFVRGNDVFFFHEEDLLGTTTLRLVKDHLIEEIIYKDLIIHKDLAGKEELYDLDKEAEKITEKIKAMKLIWEAIQEQFEILVKKLIIKTAVEMGTSRTDLTDIVIQSEKISEYPEVKKSLINIIEGSSRYEDLNIVEVYDKQEKLSDEEKKKLDEILGKVKGKGFCDNCGKVILENEFACSKCKQQIIDKKLLKTWDAANEASMRFKQEKLQEEKLFLCPNPDCDAMIGFDWEFEECPACRAKFTIKADNTVVLISLPKERKSVS